uniref:FIP-RBD domain-containing protein n=1 Tax=Macrostomum lignano TaxID=282301 RepID=A0A1I8FXH2_9PLAT
MNDAPEDSPIPLTHEFAGFIHTNKYTDVIESIGWELNDQQKLELLQKLQQLHPDGLNFEQLNEEIDHFSNSIEEQADLDLAPEADDISPKTASSNRQSPIENLEIVSADELADSNERQATEPLPAHRSGEQRFEDWGGSQMLIDLSTPPPEPASSAGSAATANGKPPLPPVTGNLQRGTEVRITWPRHRSRPASLGISGGEASPTQGQSPSSSPNRRMQRRLSAVQLAQQLFSSSSGRSSPRNASVGGSGGGGGSGMSEADLAAIEMAAQFNDHMTDQLRVLTDQVTKLTSTQTQSDSRQSRLMEDNQQLRERLLRLEDEYREAEARFSRDREADKARAREKLAKLTREKDEEIESLMDRLRGQESQSAELRQEALRLRAESERFRLEAARLEEKLEAAEQRLTAAKGEADRARETARRELDGVREERNRVQSALDELQAEAEALRTGGGD